MADSYRDLIAWRKACELALEIYRSTQAFPRAEVYGLTSQMRRAAVSIASNIAEGKGRYSQKEFVQFLFRARGSLLEIETQLHIAHELSYLETKTFQQIQYETVELGGILSGLIKSIQKEHNAA
ncbi:MAG: four helix bundle protein [Terriglobales bacterium]